MHPKYALAIVFLLSSHLGTSRLLTGEPKPSPFRGPAFDGLIGGDARPWKLRGTFCCSKESPYGLKETLRRSF
jgi:hypothetical protein